MTMGVKRSGMWINARIDALSVLVESHHGLAPTWINEMARRQSCTKAQRKHRDTNDRSLSLLTQRNKA